MKKNKPINTSRRSFFSKGAQAVGSVAAVAIVAATATAESISDPEVPIPQPIYRESMVRWPCQKCAFGHHTPADIFEATKFNTRCTVCATIQAYRWHLMKFDPKPTDYMKNPAGSMPSHPLAQIHTDFSKPKV